jgi:hypothetical protein
MAKLDTTIALEMFKETTGREPYARELPFIAQLTVTVANTVSLDDFIATWEHNLGSDWEDVGADMSKWGII